MGLEEGSRESTSPEETIEHERKILSPPKTQNSELNPVCSTPVNPSRRHGVGPLGGNRVVWGVRVDENLKERVVPKLRHAFGSDCRAVESWLMAFESIYDDAIERRGEWVNPGHTSINLNGDLNILRAQQPRRKLPEEDALGYSVDELELVENTVNRFYGRFRKYGTGLSRMEVLKLILHEHPKMDWDTRKKLAQKVLDEFILRKKESDDL